ncbi:ABC transporter ATP-binding protein [Streptococcus gallolyticus]|uniref:Putative multidrug ABC exporter, ATP binding/memb rane-spanning protein n=1 Tax=Streptococcus gallolyticus TaxID=315405 RepID=A0A060RL95_9STRE|nr:ABC transporter ATP-binding protein [Streptococcus gallolyticus]MCO7177844.1 ABC transporter ATP-binding protein/permease [Streptococcus gallolyticus]MCY7150765.1 ABC transporter ATP-binding protein/permease [Streptococcus gallolyticus subsp. gallolyticus]MCY7165506.1 ABC transporter ATP-binding protein/permease [Streptococcus gallolyticus subsp. gallolyticus]MCY7182604.1 ABC transporter ATP-binding protein/permease [Streptococcus gallolyticus subsp. gallolyticus]CDO18772.1 Putative multidr
MLKILKRLTAKEVTMLIFAVLFVCLNVYLELKIPDYMSDITTLLSTEGTKVKDIFAWNFDAPGMRMVLLSLGSFAASVVVGFLAARIAASFSTRLRDDIFHSVLNFSDAEIKKFSIPSLLTRTTNDITQIQLVFTMGIQVITKGPIMAIWAITKIADKNHEWLLVLIVAVAVMFLMIIFLLMMVMPKQRMIQTLTDKLNSITRESLTGIRVVRAYNAEDYQDAKFAQANDNVTNLNLFIGRSMALLSPVMTGISSGMTLAIYWIGAHLIENIAIPTDPTKIAGAMQDKVDLFSDMVVYSSYAMQVVMGFMMMIVVFFILPRAVVAAGRINEVLETKSSIEYPETNQAQPTEKGSVEFDNVSFRYSKNSEAVLEHVSFKAKAGDTVAFIGSTGSGKSTLVNLIPRFYDATEGTIKVDGIDVRQYDHDTLHKIVGYIPQKAVLFSGDIASNMDMGESNSSPLDDDKMWEALDLAQGKTFVEMKDGKLKAPVAQGGQNFSGGQKQRLAIARALARKPEIIIFDDSFSALDYKTDRILRSQLKERTADMTKLIVAQRISTIMDADQILVLDEGKVVGQGTHEELLANNDVYREIAYSQLSKEELENGK